MKNFIFRLLLERLKYPDMLVREQTFHALKDFLLINQSFKDDFLLYLETQSLESKVLELLVIVYLIQQSESTYFSFEEIDSKISSSSLLSDIILEEIFNINILNLYKNRSWIFNHIEEVPENFKSETEKYNGLVEANLNYFDKINIFNLPIRKQFGYEYINLLKKEDCTNYGNINYFCEMRYQGFPNIKLHQDDIQISAFLRVISHYVDSYDLQLEYAISLVQDFFPLDLGLLVLKPASKPEFIEKLVNNDFKHWDFYNEDFLPVYLSCPIKRDIYSFSDKEISDIDIYPVHLYHTPTSLEHHFNLFRYDVPKKMIKIPWHKNIKNLTIPKDIPKDLIGLFHKCCNYVQKLYTIDRDLFIPNEENLKIVIDNDKLLFILDEQAIGYMQYWYDDYTVFSYKDAPVCTGIITYFHKDYISKINKNRNLTLLVNYKKFNTDNREQFKQTENKYFTIIL